MSSNCDVQKIDEPASHMEVEEEDEENFEASMVAAAAPVSDEQSLERERMKLLLSNFDEEQMSRYEAFRRANVNRSAVRKLANAILNQSITANVSVALSGISKVLIGEIVERARDVEARERARNGGGDVAEPLRPEHLRAAWREYKLDTGTIPRARWHRLGDMNRYFP